MTHALLIIGVAAIVCQSVRHSPSFSWHNYLWTSVFVLGGRCTSSIAFRTSQFVVELTGLVKYNAEPDDFLPSFSFHGSK